MTRSVDKEAFRLLMERYQPMAFSIALQLIHQPDVAQDLVQEAILQAYLSLGQLRNSSRFKSWFYGIVLNVCHNWRRSQRHLPLSLDLLTPFACDSPFAVSSDPQTFVEDDELRCTVQNAVRALSVPNREVMLLFYYEGLHIDEIAVHLELSQVAVKSRLHKGRNQLKKLLTTLYPELSFATTKKRISKQRSMIMIPLQMARIETIAHRVLVVLFDPAGQRVLPIWLNPVEGYSLTQSYKRKLQPQSPPEPAPIDITVNALHATAVTVQAVHIEELQSHILLARVLLHSANGDHVFEARLGDSLALAERTASPIAAGDDLLSHQGIGLPASNGKSLDQQLDELISRLEAKGANPPASMLPRVKEPQNLQFTHELEHWDLRGSFLQDVLGRTWQDYVCGTDEIVPEGSTSGAKSGYLKSNVANPSGFVDLRQGILADDFRGRTVHLSADIKLEGVQQQAALYMRVIDPVGMKGSERHLVTFQGTQDWTRYQTDAEVPEDSVFVLFGISLTGPGQVWLSNVSLDHTS